MSIKAKTYYFNLQPKNSSNTDDFLKVNNAEIQIELKNLPKLYHNTSLEALYSILISGHLDTRNRSGAKASLAPSNNKESGDWIYLSFNSALPGLDLPVQFVFSSDLLIDRNDYYLNLKSIINASSILF